jgi:phosphatidate cytidylyltransferase
MIMVADEGSSMPSPAKRGPSKELSARVLSGIVMIAVALLAAYQGGWLFAVFWLAGGTAMMAEWTNMTGVEPRRPVQVVFGLGLAALTVLLLAGAGFWAIAACAFTFLVVGSLLAQGANRKLWAASGFAYAAIIVLVPPIVRAHPNLGLIGLLWMFAVVWATDIAAYFTGRALGGPKLFPAVSPKKTWSGFCGGLLAAAVAGFLVAWGAQRSGQRPAYRTKAAQAARDPRPEGVLVVDGNPAHQGEAPGAALTWWKAQALERNRERRHVAERRDSPARLPHRVEAHVVVLAFGRDPVRLDAEGVGEEHVRPLPVVEGVEHHGDEVVREDRLAPRHPGAQPRRARGAADEHDVQIDRVVGEVGGSRLADRDEVAGLALQEPVNPHTRRGPYRQSAIARAKGEVVVNVRRLRRRRDRDGRARPGLT